MNGTQSVHQLYKRLQTVGKGSYGSVHKGIELATGNVVALKIINLEDDEVDGIQHEVALLSQLRDAPNITRYYGSYLDGPRLWIVMELAQGGSVYQLMKAGPGNTVEEKYVVILVREVLVGLAYLHKMGVIHRDIKSANVLVTAQGKVMICDFGVSALLATTSSKRNTFIGTLNWMAPEVVQAVPNYDTKADIWSLGIMIYEMIKGQPPHSNVSQERIIQLIPRAKPPRLIVGEGSKDLLDFIPLCLAEKPGDRLPAEELLKTKWIKATSKTPVTILKDLLLRYEAWSKSSSEAADLNEPLPWEQDEADELGYVDVGGENPWEFDTVRGRSVDMLSMGFLSPDTSLDTSENDTTSTIRPPASKLPSSLRLLFDDGTEEAPDPFRIPGFGGSPAPRSTDSPTPSFATPPSINPTPPRAPRRAQTAAASPLADDGPDLSKATFAFPSRAAIPTQTRSKSRLGADDDSSSEALSVSRGPSPAESMLSDAQPRAGPFYRAVRSARNVPDLEIPTPTSSAPSPVPGSSAPEEPAINLDGAMMGTTTRRPPSAGRNRSRTYASPPVFQFPPPSAGSNTPDSAQSSGSGRTVRPAHDRSPTAGHAPASSSTSGHSATHSLDAPPSARRVPASAAPASAAPVLGAGLAPGANAPSAPPLGRSHSAMPYAERATVTQSSNVGAPSSGLARKPSLNRLASVAVMETVPPTPVSARRIQRSGGSIAELGLRDVLKVPALSSEHQMGMADLLPPSPSAAALASRHAPTSSHSPLSLELPRAPPLPRPIDLPALARSHADTHAELARVVDELGQWLALVDAGLGRLLEGAGGDRIEEGEEEGLDGRRSALAIG